MARSLSGAIPLGALLLCAGAVLGGAIPHGLPAAWAGELDCNDKADAKAALRFYKEGNYEDAAKVFARLSVAHPDMLVFVRDLGACYYYLRRWEPALSNLRDYEHRKRDISPDDQAEIEGWIGEMERLRDTQAAAALAPAAPGAPAPQAAATEAAVGPVPSLAPPSTTAAAAASATAAASGSAPSAPGQPPAPGTVAGASSPEVARPEAYAAPPGNGQLPDVTPPSSPSPPPSLAPGGWPSAAQGSATYSAPASGYPPPPPGHPSSPASATRANPAGEVAGASDGGARRTVSTMLVIIGVAGIVTGAVCTYQALADFSQVEKKYDPQLASRGHDFAAAQWVGYGVGGALVAAGIILAVTGNTSSSPPSRVVFVPALGPGSATATMAGTF